jgi:hypothetical protein
MYRSHSAAAVALVAPVRTWPAKVPRRMQDIAEPALGIRPTPAPTQLGTRERRSRHCEFGHVSAET